MEFLSSFAKRSGSPSIPLTIPLTILCLLSGMSACQPPSPPMSQFEEIESNPSMGGEDTRAGSDGQDQTPLAFQERLDGAWLHYSQISTCVDIGSSLEQYNRSLYTVQVTQSEHGGLLERWEACEIDLSPVISVRAQVPEALRQSVYPIETDAGLVIGLPPSQRYASAALIELWGVEMENPLLDPMPKDTDDERLYDMDLDGEVGGTLRIGDACLAYMAQRRVTHYHGVFTAPDTIEGEALSITEQYIIDASSPLCKTAYQTRSNPNRSVFKRLRIDGRGGAINLDLDDDGSVSCDELSIGRNELFIERLAIIELDHSNCQR